MQIIKTWGLTILGVFAFLNISYAGPSEVCGNGIDDTSNGITDEGCYPHLATNADPIQEYDWLNGSIAPKTGSLYYVTEADLAVRVPYGPGISFQRFYTSKYAPGSGYPADMKNPLGEGWQHNFMSWLKLDETPDPDEVVLHTREGRDVMFTYDSVRSDATWNYYKPQKGYFVDYLRKKVTSPTEWELRFLEGGVLIYTITSGGEARLTEVQDDQSTPNKVTIDYYGAGNAAEGQIEKITDASGRYKLEFSYHTSGGGPVLISEIEYYVDTTVKATRTYSYTNLSTDRTLSKVEMGTSPKTTIWEYTYSGADGYLEVVKRGDSGKIERKFFYDGAGTSGKVMRAESRYGSVGMEFEGCDCTGGVCAGTYIFTNLASNKTCDADADCGTGNSCGGIETTGETGRCFQRKQCVYFDSSTDEDLVSAVSSSCETCDKEFEWNSDLRLTGQKDEVDNWTSFDRDSNGLVDKKVQGDDDGNPNNTNPADSVTTWYFRNNSSHPGFVTEERTHSIIKSGTCSDTVNTACKRIISTYDSAGNKTQVDLKGFTSGVNDTVVSFTYSTVYTFDTKNRMTQMSGPRASTDDIIDYTYYASGNGDDSYRLKEIKRKKDTTTYLTTTYADYTHWGLAEETEDPNGSFVCKTFDSERNLLEKKRIPMNGQTSCSASSHSSDLEEILSYDEDEGALVKIESPEGNCTHIEYDSWGRIDKMKLRDDCDASSTGVDQVYTYNDEGALIKIEHKDSTGAVFQKDEWEFDDKRKVEKKKNVVDSGGAATDYTYFDNGLLKSVLAPDDIGKKEYFYDEVNRKEKVKIFTSASVSEDWTLSYDESSRFAKEVEDEESKKLKWTYDDLNRKIKQDIPDAGVTLLRYDEASNLISKIEDYNGSDEIEWSYEYDTLNRLTVVENEGSACTGSDGKEIEYSYDTSPVTCPTGACNNATGRLVYVEAKLWCDSAETDKMFDQEKFYSYDDAGRITQIDTSDDASRTTVTKYEWNENSQMTKVTTPSGIDQTWTYDLTGGFGHNSDMNYPNLVKRNTSGLVTNARYHPLGMLKEYRHYNKVTSSFIWANFDYNEAGRVTQIDYTKGLGGASIFKIDFTEDVNGRYTLKDYTGGFTWLSDTHITYDKAGRVICDAKASGTCPESGTNLRRNIVEYNTSGDAKKTRIKWGTMVDAEHITTFDSSTKRRIGSTTKGASYTISYTWDNRGNRLTDDDSQYTGSSDDKRTYTYDERNNLITVKGHIGTGCGIACVRYDDYTLTNAYDENNYRIFKSFVNEYTDVESHWFYSYDITGRLIEVKHVPDISDDDDYSIYQFYYLGKRPVAYYQIDYVNDTAQTTTKYYYHSDEQNRPLETYDYPTSGDATRKWAVDPHVFGGDDVKLGSTIYQPLRFVGHYADFETKALSGTLGIAARPELYQNKYRQYDPYTSTYLQYEPRIENTWTPYHYAKNNPVHYTDSTGTAPGVGVGPGVTVHCYLHTTWLPASETTTVEGGRSESQSYGPQMIITEVCSMLTNWGLNDDIWELPVGGIGIIPESDDPGENLGCSEGMDRTTADFDFTYDEARNWGGADGKVKQVCGVRIRSMESNSSLEDPFNQGWGGNPEMQDLIKRCLCSVKPGSEGRAESVYKKLCSTSVDVAPLDEGGRFQVGCEWKRNTIGEMWWGIPGYRMPGSKF